GVRDDQRDAMAAQQRDERLGAAALAADLDRVAEGHRASRPSEAPPFEALVVFAGQRRGLVAALRQQREKSLEALVEGHPLGKLPQDRAELRPQTQEPGREEVGERRLHVAQLLHVRDEAAALDGEDEVVGRLLAPVLEGLRALQGVKGSVEFDRSEATRRVLELLPLRQPLRVELPSPRRIAKARDPDANVRQTAPPSSSGR